MTLKKCPSCGHQHDSADIVCPYCKHSYSEKKYICNNCGAYLQPADKLCYVCGQIVEGDAVEVAEPPVVEETAQPVYEQTVEDIAKRVAQGETTYKDINEENQEEPELKPKKSKAKRALIACTVIVVIVALLAAGACLCHYNGWITLGEEQPEDASITVYFEKPVSNQNLITADGTVYNWTGDVDVNYIVEGKEYKDLCKMTDEYDSIWYAEIPEDAQEVFFSETLLETVSTATVDPIDGYIYYVTDILFNNDLKLPVEGCLLRDFEGFGINHMIPEAPATELETETATETETEVASEDTSETEAPAQTEPATQTYDITIPEQWQDKLIVVEKDNCTIYYEKYNYENYDCGVLFTVFEFDANDNSYSEMNVQKVVALSDGKRKIVVTTPTDVQFNDGDSTAIDNYINMSQFTDEAIESITEK